MHHNSISDGPMADIWCHPSTRNKRHEQLDGIHTMHAVSDYLGPVTITEEADSLGSRYHLLSSNPLGAFEANDHLKEPSMTAFTEGAVISIEIDGQPYTGSYVIDGNKLIVYADGHGQDTAMRGTTADALMAKMVLRSIIERGGKR